jgi:hypothetical protein
MNSFWYIDGSVYPKVAGRGVTIYATPVTMARAKLKPFSLDSQTLLEPAARLKDMDAGGVDVQVIFPTIFLEPLSEDPRFEATLMKSYNRLDGFGLRQASDLAQMGGCFTHAFGARSGRGDAPREGSRRCGFSGLRNCGGDALSHEDFDPVWSGAERLQASSLCAHWLVPSGPQASLHRQLRCPRPRLYLARYDRFLRVLGGGILGSFSAAKVAFLEAGVDWVLT